MDTDQTAPSAPSAPAPVAPPAAPNTLAEFRAQKAASTGEAPPTPLAPATAVSAPTIHTAVEEPPEPPEEGDELPPDAQAEPKGPEPAAHRWKDPDTGMTLDLRRRDHRRMKRLLEERADLARQVQASRYAPEPQRQEPQQARQQPQAEYRPDPNDPEPQLEQFAEQPDPYAAHTRAVAKWEARQEFRQLQATHTRVERARQVQQRITSAQQAYDAELPSVKARYPDFDAAHQDVLDTLARVPMKARASIVHRLLTSPVRHDLTHHLGSHPDDLAAVVSARNPYEQGLVLGAIETRVRALVNQRTRGPASQTPTPPPPAPMAPVGGTASPVAMPDASKMTLQQFRANKKRLGMSA